jgi:hypothetical protein
MSTPRKAAACIIFASGEAFEKAKIAFVYAKQGLNIELIDTKKKAKLIDAFLKKEQSA